jgi:hypothetical protein
MPSEMQNGSKGIKCFRDKEEEGAFSQEVMKTGL